MIKSATVDDLPRISALAGVIWRESYPGIISAEQIEYMLGRMYDVDTMRREVTEQRIRYDLLFSSPLEEGPGEVGSSLEAGPGEVGSPLEAGPAEVIGFVSYGPGHAPGEMKIHKLYLLKAYQGRGLGSTMLRHAIDLAREAGCTSVILNVNKYNERAIATYRRHGFTVREAVVVDIGGGFVMDDYVMQLPLDTEASQ